MLLHVRLVRGWSRVDTLYLYYFKCKNRRLSNVHISSLTMSFLFFLSPSRGLSSYLYNSFKSYEWEGFCLEFPKKVRVRVKG